MTRQDKCDVIVVGGGGSAFECAVSARQNGAKKVVMVEKAPPDEFGSQFGSLLESFLNYFEDPLPKVRIAFPLEQAPHFRRSKATENGPLCDPVSEEDLRHLMESSFGALWSILGAFWAPRELPKPIQKTPR